MKKIKSFSGSQDSSKKNLKSVYEAFWNSGTIMKQFYTEFLIQFLPTYICTSLVNFQNTMLEKIKILFICRNKYVVRQ